MGLMARGMPWALLSDEELATRHTHMSGDRALHFSMIAHFRACALPRAHRLMCVGFEFSCGVVHHTGATSPKASGFIEKPKLQGG